MSPFSDAERQARHRALLADERRTIADFVRQQRHADEPSDDERFIKACHTHLQYFYDRTPGASLARTARQLYPGDQWLTRAATTPMVMAGNDLGGFAMPDTIVGLCPQSVAAALIDRGPQIDMTGVAQLGIPRILMSATDSGNWVADGVAGPVRALTFGALAILEPRKLVVHCVLTREVAVHTSAQSIVRPASNRAARAARTNGARPCTSRPTTRIVLRSREDSGDPHTERAAYL
jgi:hypothetical protein